MKLGVGSSSALSFRFDLQSVRLVERETLHQNDLFALAPPMGGASYGGDSMQKKLVADLDERAVAMSETPPPPAEAAEAPMAAQAVPAHHGVGKGSGAEAVPRRPRLLPRSLARPQVRATASRGWRRGCARRRTR